MGPIEPEEFDATQYPPEHVTVGLDESIQSILERVEEGWVRSPNVVLIIPRGAQAFHNTHDFLALGKLPGARQVRVSIASPDPTIAGLARVLGFHIVDVPPDHPVLTQDPTLGLPTEDDIEKPTSPLPLGTALGSWGKGNEWVLTESQQAPSTPKRDSLTTSTWLTNPEEYEPLAVGAVAETRPPASRQGPKLKAQGPKPAVPVRIGPRQTSQLSSVSLSSKSLLTPEDGDASASKSALRTPHSAIGKPWVSPTPSGRIKARSVMVPDDTRIDERKLRYGSDIEKQFKWGRLLAVMLLVVVASLVGGAYYAFTYLPEASISVTPLDDTVTVSAELTISLTDTTGQRLSPVGEKLNPSASLISSSAQQSAVGIDLIATLIKATITEEGTRPASGARQVPRGIAQGTMSFTNRTSNPVTVPSGLKFKAPNGVFVQTTQSGTVRATDFNSQAFGTLTLPIAATVEGPDGNIGPGQIGGVYADKLNYINSALQGGSMDTLKVVTQEDIDALEAQLRSQAGGKVGGAILQMVPQGQVLITQTVQLANVDVIIDRKAGEDAESVSVKLTAEAHAYVYKESDVRAAVTQVALDWVRANISNTVGPNLDLNSVQYTPPTLQSFDVAAGKAIYATSANGHVTFTLTDELARQIRDLVKGKEVKQARNLISSRYGKYVNTSSLQAKVLWFTIDKLPTDPARISIESTSGASANGSGSSTSLTQDTSDPRSSQP
ncbi:MAG TPA: hypothetical protein VJ183_09340 [Chloroflexia bacterium]|nr:hypothetical protein [Chloroflexia bacterium]